MLLLFVSGQRAVSSEVAVQILTRGRKTLQIGLSNEYADQ